MSRPQSNLRFRLMSLSLKFRDLFVPPRKILKEVDIKPGFHVLDYGSGPGSFLVPLSELVGKSGKLYALDIHPLATQKVQGIASKKQLTNVFTICSDCQTRLPDGSIDAALFYDTFHMLGDADKVLRELHRVLKRDGILSFSDHHLDETQIVSNVTSAGLFTLVKKGKRTYTFLRRSSEQRN